MFRVSLMGRFAMAVSKGLTEVIFGTSMASILILGAYGLLGNVLSLRLVERGYIVLRQGRSDVAEICIDPVDSNALKTLLAQQRVDVVVNLVAATNVDQCEVDPQGAYRANVQVVEALAHAIDDGTRNVSPHLIHISTDQVYDGQGPHQERVVGPCNVYALSKLAGEFVAAKIGATVLRTNFFGRSKSAGRISLSDWIINSLGLGKNITVFDDVLFSALHIDTLCEAIELAICERHAGTFNVGCKNGGSKAHLAFGLAERLQLDQKLMTVGRAQDVKLRARRPLDMRMDSSHFERTFGFVAPPFESQIDLAAQEYRNE
jgi:dTDP-4-dehydrorhamnose reductase